MGRLRVHPDPEDHEVWIDMVQLEFLLEIDQRKLLLLMKEDTRFPYVRRIKLAGGKVLEHVRLDYAKEYKAYRGSVNYWTTFRGKPQDEVVQELPKKGGCQLGKEYDTPWILAGADKPALAQDIKQVIIKGLVPRPKKEFQNSDIAPIKRFRTTGEWG